LIEACRAGQHEAWDELVDRYGRLIYSIPHRYRMSPADADDVFQNVFTILLRRLDTLRDETKLSSWLITTTHRECWRIGRRAASFPPEDITRFFDDLTAPPEDETIRWEQQHLVRQALEELGGRCQRLLTALFLAGEKPRYDRVAEELGMRVSSIGPTRSRCFRKLGKILARLGVEPPPTASEDDGD
jgi:RNA polymerase sigma factor (sigma-70 family)